MAREYNNHYKTQILKKKTFSFMIEHHNFTTKRYKQMKQIIDKNLKDGRIHLHDASEVKMD